jgi:hypothetical protein
MKQQIQKLYVDALNEDLPPNVFAEQVLRLFDVMRGASEIEARINDIEQNKANLQIDYAYSKSTKERLLLVQMITECDLRIKDLKWCMGL